MEQLEKEITGKDGAEMVLIPAGEFLMGSPEGEGGAEEHPRHTVYLDAFYMDKYDVTAARYRKFCEATRRSMPEQPSWSTDNHPVVNVAWNDAVAYAEYYGKRLPTEAEWEKACRAGTDTKYYFGDRLSPAQAKFNSTDGAVPVGSYPPNAYGLYDMHGNVWQWCSDWYGSMYYSNSPYKNPQGPERGINRVLRGGGWDILDYFCRSANRYRYFPVLRNYYGGFRCAARSGAEMFWQSGFSGNPGFQNSKETIIDGASRKKIINTDKSAESNLIGGKYEILRELGRGGMGIVYEGLDVKLERKVAIKKMRDEIKINIRAKKRFLEEAKKVAKLQNANIIGIYDILEDGGDSYIVFEFVDGHTLDELLDKKGKFEAEKAAEMAIEICKALEYAHTKGIIHRDIKPANIMLSSDKQVKVMDFGIAREMSDTISRVTGEQTSGTLAYMAPEQELGKTDERADIYALGITIYEMLTGDVPFKGPNFLAQKERMAYAPLQDAAPGAPEALCAIVAKCLQADKEKRYRGAEELKEALEKIKY